MPMPGFLAYGTGSDSRYNKELQLKQIISDSLLQRSTVGKCLIKYFPIENSPTFCPPPGGIPQITEVTCSNEYSCCLTDQMIIY